MKLSVSVPDELWDSAREGREHLGASAVVQAALDALVERDLLEQASAYARALRCRNPERCSGLGICICGREPATTGGTR